MVEKDIDFAAQLDALDEQEEQPAYVSPDVGGPMDFGLPESTKKLIDTSVGEREDERRRQDAIDKARGILDKYKEKFQQDKEAKFGPQMPGVKPEDDFWGGEFLRSLGRSGVGTSDMVGGSMRQTATSLRLQGGAENEVLATGLETKGQELSDQAQRITRQLPAARVDDYTKIRTESISSFARDVNDYVQQGLGQVLGYYGPMYVGYKVLGLPGLFLSSAALSVGEVRQTLEEAGVTDPKLLESYGWTAGMTVAALDAIVPGEILTAPVKKGLQKYALTRIATATSKMGLKEAVTEAMQEMVQITAAANAAGIQVGEDRASEQVYNMGRELYAKRWQIANAGALGFIGGKVLATPGAIQAELSGQRPASRLEGIAGSAKPLAESGATIEPDTRTIAPSQEGPTPRLKPGEGSVRGPVDSEPAIQDAERLLSEIEVGTIAEPSPEGGSSTTVEKPAEAAPRAPVPTFNDILAVLPPDTNGDPDLAPLFEALQGRPYGQLAPEEKVALIQQLRGETPAAPKEAAPAPATAAPEAVSAPQAATVAPETAAATAAPQAAPRSLTEAIQQAAPQIEAAAQAVLDGNLTEQAAKSSTAVGQAERARFSEILATKEKRSNWAAAAGLSDTQIKTLTDEALADGRLRMLKGNVVRTAKARAPSPQNEVARAATSVPMGRAAEVRLEKVTNDVAYKHAAALLGAGRNRDAALKKLAGDKKATRAVLDEVHLALTGKPSKSMRKKADVIESIRKAEIVQAKPAAPAAPTVAPVEESSVPLQDIVNPIDRTAPIKEQLRQIAALTAENKPILDAQLKELDAAIGTTSNANVKKPETIVSKASRPSILASKPWHTIAHIRDTLRFQTKISTFDQIEKAAEFMLSRGYRIVKIDTAKMLEPKEWGWRFAGFDMRAPNGQLLEWYIIFDEMYAAKKKGHLLFEKWRNANDTELKDRYDEYRADVVASRQLYLEAFERGLKNSGYAGLEDARADISKLSASLPEMSAKLSARSDAAGGVKAPLGSQGPSSDSRNASAPLGSMTQQRPDSRSSNTTGLSISETSSTLPLGGPQAFDNEANGRIQIAAIPPRDSYALRTLQTIDDPVVKGHYQALINAGTNVESAVSALASDRRLDDAERQQIAEAYVGGPVPDQTPLFGGVRPPADRAAYIDGAAYRSGIASQYVEGEIKKASSREVPFAGELPPLGAWRIDPFKGIHGQEIEHLVKVKIADLSTPETANGLDPMKSGDDARYAQWLRDGLRAPPIEVVQREDGSLRVIDGHRRVLAAKIAGMDEIEAWVNYISPVADGRLGSNGKPIMTGLTYELAHMPAIREAAARRSREITLAVTSGFPAEISPSNLRVRDLDAQMVVGALQRLAERLPSGAGLAVRSALRVALGERVAALEGATVSPEAAMSALGIDAGSAKKLIAVSLEYGPDVAMQTFTHEEIHLLRSLDILKGKDWDALAGLALRRPKKTEATRVLDSMLANGKIDQETYDAQIGQAGKLTYRQLYQIDARYGDFLNGNEDLLIEETVAHAAADWANGREFASPIERAFQRIRDFLEAIQNAMNGLGFRSANDVFESIWAGELTRKFEEARERRFEAEERGLEWMRENGVTAMALGPQRSNLDMSPEARKARAEAMGFDTSKVWYHGTGGGPRWSAPEDADGRIVMQPPAFDSFDDAKIGSANDAGHYGRGHYLVNNPGEASYYGQRVSAFYARGNFLELDNTTGDLTATGHFKDWAPKLDAIGALGPHAKSALSSLKAFDEYVDANVVVGIGVNRDGSEGYIARVKSPIDGDTYEYDSFRGQFHAQREDAIAALKYRVMNEIVGRATDQYPALDYATTSLSDYIRTGEIGARRLSEIAKASGYDGISVADELVVFDPSNIRSVDAAFDPAASDSPLLMAAFAGERAQTADQEALSKAKQMEGEGASRESIWHETGWFKGVDGRWRFEIDDSKSKLRAFGPDFSLLQVELTHEELFKAYPQMAEVEFNRVGAADYEGMFTPGGILPSAIAISKDAKDRRSTVLHESQHGVQDIEGFAEGGSADPGDVISAYNRLSGAMTRIIDDAGGSLRNATPEQRAEYERLTAEQRKIPLTGDTREDAHKFYKRLAGEVESRTVQKRLSLTPEQRANRAPWLDYDVPESQQIVRMPDGSTQTIASVDLDMSETARLARAAEMGFDTSEVLYHGTSRRFEGFEARDDDELIGARAIWLTPSARLASTIADGAAFRERISGGEEAPSIVSVYTRGSQYIADASSEPDLYRGAPSVRFHADRMAEVIRRARASGYESVRFRDITDEGVTADQVAVFEAANIRSTNAAFDPADANSPVLMASLRDWLPSRKPTPPQSTPQGDSPGLNKIISDLKKTLGMPVSQGLWGMTVQQGNRSARVRPPSNVKGQFDRETGNVSVRQSRDIKTLAHEGGHYLESILGADLGVVKQGYAEALTGDPNAMPAALSEGFARWFESYILDPQAAEARAPGMTEAFEELLEAERPDMLGAFDTIQNEYQRYITSAPIGEVAAGLSSQYDGTTWRELSADKALDNVSGKLSSAYQGVVDGLNVAAKGVQYLLKTADANGIRDADGRPISIKVGDNFYKRLRLFSGAFSRGRAWLEKGVSDLETGQIIGPSLKAALDRAMGDGKFDMKRYKDFNQYLVSIRALEEFNRLDQKQATLDRYDGLLQRASDARPVLADRLAKDGATLARREDALIRNQTMLRDRRRMLGVAETRLEATQDRLQGILDDLAEADEAQTLAGEIADPVASRAVSENYRNMVARRQRSRQIAERDQQQALRLFDNLSREVSELEVEATTLEAEIAQRRDMVSTGQERVAQLDAMRTQLTRERNAAKERGASRPPTAEPRAVHERVIRELGTPEFQEAAKLVHDFTFSLLEARRQAGFISQELFDELAKRKDWYVPFWRDMSDIEGAGTMFPGSGVKKWSMFKKFDGSDRSILMPLEVLSEEAYSTAQQIAFNDVVKTMVGLAERVGPGGGKVAERLARAENMEANDETFGKIKQMAIDLGIDPLDAHMITQRMEMNFSDGDIRVILAPENLGPTAKPQLPLWENGERVMVRLPDPAFGRDLFEAINGLGKEMSDILVKALALPAQMLRVGVTSHPDFIFRNIWRDMWTAWKLTGAVPVITQARGFRLIGEGGQVDGMSGEDFRRLYNEAGGVAGGMNLNVEVANAKRDVKSLLDTNIDKKAIAAGGALLGFTGVAAGSSIGSMLGLVFGGPVGAGVGFKVGATVGGLVGGLGGGYAARHGEVWKVVESFETATRLGVAAHAYKRAKAHNPDLSDMEAITEAAFVSRDILDWNRRGSKMLAATRLVTFLNAQIQGLDKQLRQMSAQGDRGSVLKKHLGIVFKHQSNDILSVDEQRDLADAYKSYLRWGAISLMLMGLYALSGDDDDYQDIKDQTKWTHSWFKSLGIWFRLPKPFELAVPSNIGEILWDKYRGYDQRAAERVVDSMYEVLAPPGLPQVMRLAGGIMFNRDRQGIFKGQSREIVGENLASRPPHERYHAFSSEFAIDLSRAMYQAGVPQSLIPAPVKTDFVLSAAGAYWGREVQNSYQTAKTVAGMSTRPDRKATDFPLLRGVTGEAARQSESVSEMYTMISREGGEMTMAATEYKQLMDDRGRPAEAEVWLKSLDKDQQVWALTQYYGSKSDKREHPLERARQADAINREIMRDTITDTLAPKVRQGRKQVRDFEDKIELTPAKKTEVIDILARLSQVEARNTMVLLERRGFEGMSIKDPELIMQELKAASKPVYELLMERRDKKVEDWPSVQREWPRYRDRVLKQGVNAF